jgi:hypothetical protein
VLFIRPGSHKLFTSSVGIIQMSGRCGRWGRVQDEAATKFVLDHAAPAQIQRVLDGHPPAIGRSEARQAIKLWRFLVRHT